MNNENFEPTWYIVASPSEEDAIRSRLRSAATDLREGISALLGLADELTHAPVGHADPFPTANASSFSSARSGSLSSVLYDTLNAAASRGSYTESQVLIFHGRSYLLANSPNKSGGPPVAVFRPDAEGQLTLLCEYDAPNAEWKWVGDQSDDECPATGGRQITIKDEIPIEWVSVPPPFDRQYGEFYVATLPFPDGPQMVVRMDFTDSHYLLTRHLIESEPSRGRIKKNIAGGRAAFEDVELLDNYEGTIEADATEFVLTKSGLFLANHNFVSVRRGDSPPLGIVYDRIGPTGPERVCSFTQEYVPPPAPEE